MFSFISVFPIGTEHGRHSKFRAARAPCLAFSLTSYTSSVLDQHHLGVLHLAHASRIPFVIAQPFFDRAAFQNVDAVFERPNQRDDLFGDGDNLDTVHGDAGRLLLIEFLTRFGSAGPSSSRISLL